MSKRLIRNTSIAFLLLYIGYYACVSLFVHTHIYNGLVYIHSHPYKKTADDDKNQLPYQTHQHTNTAFFALNSISNIASFEAGDILCIEPPIVATYILDSKRECTATYARMCDAFSRRGPPYLS